MGWNGKVRILHGVPKLGDCMNHKRGRPKNRRSGCLMCKPNKMNGWNKNKQLGHKGFGKIRDEIHAEEDLMCRGLAE